jgi:hypothetical protein
MARLDIVKIRDRTAGSPRRRAGQGPSPAGAERDTEPRPKPPAGTGTNAAPRRVDGGEDGPMSAADAASSASSQVRGREQTVARARPAVRRPGPAPYIAAVVLLMLCFLGWLLSQWVSYLGGGSSLADIFGVIAAGGVILLGVGARRPSGRARAVAEPRRSHARPPEAAHRSPRRGFRAARSSRRRGNRLATGSRRHAARPQANRSQP